MSGDPECEVALEEIRWGRAAGGPALRTDDEVEFRVPAGLYRVVVHGMPLSDYEIRAEPDRVARFDAGAIARGGAISGVFPPGETVELHSVGVNRTRLLRRVVTGSSGRVQFQGLAPGRYVLTRALAAGRVSATFEVSPSSLVRVPDASLWPATSVRVRLLRSDGSPYREAVRVGAAPPVSGPRFTVRPDENGFVEFTISDTGYAFLGTESAFCVFRPGATGATLDVIEPGRADGLAIDAANGIPRQVQWMIPRDGVTWFAGLTAGPLGPASSLPLPQDSGWAVVSLHDRREFIHAAREESGGPLVPRPRTEVVIPRTMFPPSAAAYVEECVRLGGVDVSMVGFRSDPMEIPESGVRLRIPASTVLRLYPEPAASSGMWIEVSENGATRVESERPR